LDASPAMKLWKKTSKDTRPAMVRPPRAAVWCRSLLWNRLSPRSFSSRACACLAVRPLTRRPAGRARGRDAPTRDGGGLVAGWLLAQGRFGFAAIAWASSGTSGHSGMGSRSGRSARLHHACHGRTTHHSEGRPAAVGPVLHPRRAARARPCPCRWRFRAAGAVGARRLADGADQRDSSERTGPSR
jgi:hypothetical protein